MALIYALDRPWMSRWESSGRREEHARSFRWSRGTGDLRQLRKNWQPLVRVRRKKERKEEKTEEHRSVEQPRLLLTIELDNNAANEPTTRSHNEPSRLPTFLNSPLVDILCVSRLLTPRKSLAKETTRGFDEDDGYHVSLRWSPPSTMINDDNNRGSFVALPSILLDFSTSRRVERQLVELDEFGQLWLRTRDKPRRRSRENSLWNSLTDFGSGTRSDEWNANRNSREARAKLTRAVTRSTVLYEWLVFPPGTLHGSRCVYTRITSRLADRESASLFPLLLNYQTKTFPPCLPPSREMFPTRREWFREISHVLRCQLKSPIRYYLIF